MTFDFSRIERRRAKYRIKGDAKKMKMASAAGASHSPYGRAPQARVRLLHERNCILHHKRIAEICCQSVTFHADSSLGASSKHRLCHCCDAVLPVVYPTLPYRMYHPAIFWSTSSIIIRRGFRTSRSWMACETCGVKVRDIRN